MSFRIHEIELNGTSRQWLFDYLGEHGRRTFAPVVDGLCRLFRITSDWAPGLHFFGAQAGLASASPEACGARLNFSGSGIDPVRGLISCLGEGAERLSTIERPGDIAIRAPIREVRTRILPSALALIEERSREQSAVDGTKAYDWCSGFDPIARREVLLPAAWSLGRHHPDHLAIPGSSISTGVAAGPSQVEATVRAQLELAERDAAAIWWIAGRRGCPIAVEHPAGKAAQALTEKLRSGTSHRKTWLIDITTELGVPVVAAISSSRDGSQVAIGLGARLSLADAAEAALLELCQMEIGMQIALVKLSKSALASLSRADQVHARRASELEAASCDLLIPLDVPTRRAAITLGDEGLIGELAGTAGCLALVNLTRPEIGIPVVRAVMGHLQPMPSSIVTQRLSSALRQHGGDTPGMRGMKLM